MRRLGAPLGLLIAALLFGLPSAPQRRRRAAGACVCGANRRYDRVGHVARARLLHARIAVRPGDGRRACRAIPRAAPRRVRRPGARGDAASRRRAPRAHGVPDAEGTPDAGRFARQRPLVPARRDHRVRHGTGLRDAARVMVSRTHRPDRNACPSGTWARPGSRRSTFAIPDGHFLEILAFPPGKGDPKWHRPGDALFLGLDHTAIVVDDTDAVARVLPRHARAREWQGPARTTASNRNT